MAKENKVPAKGSTKNKGKKKGRIRQFFRDVKSELKKATWPTKKELVKYTGVVLAFIAIFSVVVGLLDYGLAALLGLITG
ncbi:MAG: preprotein translocase subunit SecE [Clostridia bacterium]|nr:preprotein translocase subunit SecE [Clostridia bacterium]